MSATVAITNKAGQKLPSGVGFRRAFVEFRVTDASGDTLWASGRTNAAGVLVDGTGSPVAGEYWWTQDCSARIAPQERRHQPHYETITGEQQVQIYQELVSTPPLEHGPATCGQGAEPAGQLTTSFLSICARVKDNRLLPHGTLPLLERIEIARALGAGADLAEDAGPVAVDQDPDYDSGGGDRIRYEISLADLPAGRAPAAVVAALFYQATPPYYLQDRFCTSQSDDTDRLAFMVSHLNLDGSDAEDWKFEIVSTGAAAIPNAPEAVLCPA